jgi:hypothetical protein
MGKSLGTKPSGKGPGLQKRTKLQRQYLTDKKAQVKKGSMKDLDFGVHTAHKYLLYACTPLWETSSKVGTVRVELLLRGVYTEHRELCHRMYGVCGGGWLVHGLGTCAGACGVLIGVLVCI